MYKLVLVRHGQSTWNQENRFTGWTDVDLTERGIEEAIEAGQKLKEEHFQVGFAFTSLLTRAIKTLFYMLEEMDLLWIPTEKSWRFNEKHYGFLQGLNKTEMVEQYGAEQVQLWRRSYDIQPPAIPEDDPRHPKHDPRYACLTEQGSQPGTESLKDTYDRIVPYWESKIKPTLKEYKEVLIAAHGNSLRGLVKFLKNIPDDEIVSLNMPTGVPYIFEFDDNLNLVNDYFLADPEDLQRRIDEVANQTKKILNG